MGVRFAYVTGIERMSISRRASSGLSYGERSVLACWNKEWDEKKNEAKWESDSGVTAPCTCTLGDGGSPGGLGLRGLAALLAKLHETACWAPRGPPMAPMAFGMPAANQVHFSDRPPITESGRPGRARQCSTAKLSFAAVAPEREGKGGDLEEGGRRHHAATAHRQNSECLKCTLQ
jgi:hypothetical protein